MVHTIAEMASMAAIELLGMIGSKGQAVDVEHIL